MSLDLEHLGVIYYDEVQSRALNARLPIVAYKPQAILSQAIYRITERILEMEPIHLSPLDSLDSALGDDSPSHFGMFGTFSDALDNSYKTAHRDANDGYKMRHNQLQDLLHSGLLSESDMMETIKSQQFDIQQLKLENQFLKKKLLDMNK